MANPETFKEKFKTPPNFRVVPPGEQSPPPPPPKAVPFMDLVRNEPDPELTLLGERFLCKGGSITIVGPSGIGKSSASVQQDICWALGKPAFDISPSRQLKILTIQAENDAGDLGEMIRGVIGGLHLSIEEQINIGNRLLYVTEMSRTGQRFLDEVVEPLLAEHRPDIVRIDPLLAYMGGDVNLASDTGKFLRNGLNPLLSKYGCAAILVHHTPKANNRDTTNYRPSDWQYAGAGSADITNWTRGMLIFEPTHAAHVFKLIAAKRGRRLGWIDAKGEPTLVKYYCHSTTGDGIFWLEATHEDIEAMIEASPGKSKSAPKTKEDLIALVPPKATISKDLLIKNAQDAGIGANRARTLLKEAVEDKDLFEWNIKRSGTGPEKRIARHEQGTFGL